MAAPGAWSIAASSGRGGAFCPSPKKILSQRAGVSHARVKNTAAPVGAALGRRWRALLCSGAFRGPSLKYSGPLSALDLAPNKVDFADCTGLPQTAAQHAPQHQHRSDGHHVAPAHTHGRRRAAVTPPRSLLLPSDGGKELLPDGAVPRVSEDDIAPPYACDGGELAQVKRDLRNAMRRAQRRGGRRSQQSVARNLASTVHGATRRERERRAEAARAAEARAARSRALRSSTYPDALG